MSIKPAKIEFNSQQTPVASDFDDIYYSNDSGLAESRYVFIEQNHLQQRWQQWHKTEFVIAESGFGTGLNFLAVWQCFNEFRQQNPESPLRTLRFISVEKFPLTQNDLQQALRQWPTLEEFSQLLVKQYPFLHQGCHRLQFHQQSVQLDLWLGDIHQVLDSIYAPATGLIDAWFLDGFAPSKNPDMWSQRLFDNMTRLGKPDSTFATFTAAGFVRRGLQQAGYAVQKVKGYGKKREMLSGTLACKTKSHQGAPYYMRSAAKGKTVTIIGAGLAGANLAYCLSQKGYQVKIYDKQPKVAQAASGNPIGGFYPQLHADATTTSLLQAHCFGFALRHYQALLEQGHTFEHDFCGVLQLAFTKAHQQRYQKLISNQVWPNTLARYINASEVNDISGLALPYEALHIAKGGWISPPQLVNALIKAANATTFVDHQLLGLTQENDQWQLQWQVNGTQQSQTQCDIVVFASGSDSVDIPLVDSLPLRLVRGQVEKIPEQPTLEKLHTVLCHKGYLTPALDGYHALGSTYIKNDRQCQYRPQEEQTNLAVLHKALADYDWHDLYTEHQGRAAVRCSSPDHIPFMGQLPDIEQQRQQYQDLYKALPMPHYPQAENVPNIFILTGLGSRGLCTAPLLAETLACQISGAPLPLEQSLLDALSPNRFLIRALIRREEY